MLQLLDFLLQLSDLLFDLGLVNSRLLSYSLALLALRYREQGESLVIVRVRVVRHDEVTMSGLGSFVEIRATSGKCIECIGILP